MYPPIVVGQIQTRPIDQIKESSNNTRSHSASQIQQIAASIREFGFVNPILIGPDDTLIAGHGRLRAASTLKMTEVPVIVLEHLSKAQRRALMLADNQLALNAAWDEQLLRDQLAALEAETFDLQLLGFDEKELSRLVAKQKRIRTADPNAIPSAPKAPITSPGDLWILGEHRLLCGDAAAPESLERVLGAERAAMVFTDPLSAKPPSWQFPEQYPVSENLLRQACEQALAVCDGAVYICSPPSQLPILYWAFVGAGGRCSAFLVWDKQTPSPTRQSDYQSQYELILYGCARGAKPYWAGGRNQSDVWSFIGPPDKSTYSEAKPIELIEKAIQNSSRTADIVLDPFAGTGATLIACEQQNRRARLVEIDPKHVDLICRRWQDFSGKPALLDQDGRPFEEIRKERKAA